MVCKKAGSTFLLREILLLVFQRRHDPVHTLRKTWASRSSIWFLSTVLRDQPRPGLSSDHLFGATAWAASLLNPGRRRASRVACGQDSEPVLGATIAQQTTTSL